jgi:hypothetical protein
MNKLKKFLAYGAVLETSLGLNDYLVPGASGRYSLRLSERAASAPSQALKIHTAVFKSHSRQLSFYSDREFGPSVKGQLCCLEVSDVVRFYWVSGQCNIEYETLEQCTEKLLAFWLIHIFLPLYFTLEGMYEFIHACAVEVSGDSILFVARSQGGKSTLTDFAVPSHPNHRPYRKFEDLGYRVSDFSTKARSVDAIYALQAVDPEAEVSLTEISGHRKFARLLPNYLFNFSFLKAKRLKYLADMVSVVPIYRVEVPWDLDRLQEVHDAILEHRFGAIGD